MIQDYEEQDKTRKVQTLDELNELEKENDIKREREKQEEQNKKLQIPEYMGGRTSPRLPPRPLPRRILPKPIAKTKEDEKAKVNEEDKELSKEELNSKLKQEQQKGKLLPVGERDRTKPEKDPGQEDDLTPEEKEDVDKHIDDTVDSEPKEDSRLAQLIGEVDKANQNAIAKVGRATADKLVSGIMTTVGSLGAGVAAGVGLGAAYTASHAAAAGATVAVAATALAEASGMGAVTSGVIGTTVGWVTTGLNVLSQWTRTAATWLTANIATEAAATVAQGVTGVAVPTVTVSVSTASTIAAAIPFVAPIVAGAMALVSLGFGIYQIVKYAVEKRAEKKAKEKQEKAQKELDDYKRSLQEKNESMKSGMKSKGSAYSDYMKDNFSNQLKSAKEIKTIMGDHGHEALSIKLAEKDAEGYYKLVDVVKNKAKGKNAMTPQQEEAYKEASERLVYENVYLKVFEQESNKIKNQKGSDEHIAALTTARTLASNNGAMAVAKHIMVKMRQ